MRRLWPYLILVLVTSLVYLNSFPGAFHFDDFPLLLESPRINTSDFSYGSFLDQYGGRPLTLWTFYWNYRFFEDEPFSYHFVSVALHALVVAEIFLLIFQLFGQRLLAFGCALLFAVHPLQTQTVNYIWSRSVLLMAVLGLASLLLARRHPWAGLLCLQLAIWGRSEAIVLFIPLIFLSRAHWKGPVILALANTAALVYSLLKYTPREIGWSHPDPFGYWLLQPVAFWKYFSLMVWPIGLNLDYDLISPSRWVWALAIFSFLGLCILAFRFRQRYPIPALGFLWVVAMLAPSFLVPNSDILNESRAYLALAGFTLIAAWVFCKYLGSMPMSLKLAVAAPLLLFLAPLTVARNQIWTDDLALWQDTVLKSPGKARAHYNLGVALAREGKNKQAEVEFETARDLDPQDDLSYAALGYCAEVRRELGVARFLYRKALRLNPENIYARQGLERVENRIEG